MTWDLIQAARSKPVKLSPPRIDQIDEDIDENLSSASNKLAQEVFVNTELGEHLKEFRNGPIIPNEYFNSTIPWQKSRESTDKPLADFIPSSAPQKYSHSTQVSNFSLAAALKRYSSHIFVYISTGKKDLSG